MERGKPLAAIFYLTSSGNDPVRAWLKSLSKQDRVCIGVDVWKVQSEWPVGMPHVRSLGGGLYEVRSNLRNGIARVIFAVDGNTMILLHGFIKKTQKMPPDDLVLAQKRRRNYEQS
jgi:phage-related protein